MDVPPALTRPLLSAPTFLLRARAAFLSPLSLTISIRPPQQRTRHTPSLPHPSFRGLGTPPPSFFHAHFLLPPLLPSRDLSGPRSLDATTQRSIRSPVSSFSRHGLRMPPFSPGSSCPLIPVKSRLPNIPPDDAELPQGSCAFPPLRCALTPRPRSDWSPSPLPPGIRSDCNRHAFVPLHLHTQKARLLMQTGLCTAIKRRLEFRRAFQAEIVGDHHDGNAGLADDAFGRLVEQRTEQALGGHAADDNEIGAVLVDDLE